MTQIRALLLAIRGGPMRLHEVLQEYPSLLGDEHADAVRAVALLELQPRAMVDALAAAIGEEPLVARPGGAIESPTSPRALRILAAFREGVSLRAIAQSEKLSVQRTREILDRAMLHALATR